MSTIKYAMQTIVDSANTADPDVKAHNELPHLNIQCLFSRFWFWHFMWWAWELFCSVLRIILFLIFLFINIWTPKIIDIIVWKKWSACFINTYMYMSECRSNVKQYRPLSDCSWSGCALFAQVYIGPNIWGKYSVLFCSKCDKNNNILIKVHSSIHKIVLLLANYMHH